MFNAEKTLKNTVHITGVSQIVKTCLGNCFLVSKLKLLIIFTVKGLRAAFKMKILIIDSTSLVAIIYFMTDTTDDKRFLLNAFLTISFEFSFNSILTQGIAYLNNQSVGTFKILVDIQLFVFLLCDKSSLDLILFILDRLDQIRDYSICSKMAISFPYSYFIMFEKRFTIFFEKYSQFFQSPQG